MHKRFYNQPSPTGASMSPALPPPLARCLIGLAALAAPLLAAEHETGWDRSRLPEFPNPVGADAVVVDGPVDIRWKPLPFALVTGESRRFIDYAQGDDQADGLSPTSAWKHHPWDAAATGRAAAAAGIHTYVFKRGVVYRGQLRPDESGAPGDPIRLTSDPAWGEGAATISGAHAVRGGLQRTAADELNAAGFPPAAHGQVHHVAVPGDFVPHAAWALHADGSRSRLPIAREPDWETTDTVKRFAQWWRWSAVERGFPECRAFAPDELGGFSRAALKGATVWSDMPNQGGEFSITGPIPSPITGFDPKQGLIKLRPLVPRRQPEPNSPFFVEDSPALLDQPGEFWFDEATRRCYLWLPADADHESTTIELARHRAIIDIENQDHIAISGLTLTGGNSVDPTAFPETGGWKLPIPARWMAAVRLAGDVDDIELSHLHVHHSAGLGVVNHILDEGDVVSGIVIRDSRFEYLDSCAIELYRGSKWRVALPMARLHSFAILRNRIHHVGLRNTSHRDEGINVEGGELGEIAGNVISETGSKGINNYSGRLGGNASRKPIVVPLTRILIHHNLARDTLLTSTDFGGIESWGTGSTYLYGNISRDAWGYIAHRDLFHKNVAFYFDHNYKGYLFSNIGWGGDIDGTHNGRRPLSLFHKRVRGALNLAFNNTSWNVRKHYQKESGEGSGTLEIGNLAIDAEDGFISFWNIDRARDVGWSHNVYAGAYENLFDRWRGETFPTVDGLQAHVRDMPSVIARQVGWISDAAPVRDAAAHDFHPSDDSAAIDRGARVFVPWALAGTVGEWHFYRNDLAPDLVMSYDLFPQEFSTDSKMISERVPDHSLNGSGFAGADYVAGPLESWTDGALAFDGARALRVADAHLRQDVPYGDQQVWPGEQVRNLRISDGNLLIEAVLRIEPGATGGTVIAKLDGTGYALEVDERGHARFRLAGSRDAASCTTASAINDGRWHHVLVEVDRIEGRMTCSLNGADATADATGTVPSGDDSLDSAADVVVGAGLRGAIDFLRVCRGTLADAETDLGTLMAWQFNGPPLRDIKGRLPHGQRDAGAIEHLGVSGQQPIVYQPKGAPTAAGDGEDDGFDQGPDRSIASQPWGAISVPKQTSPGATIAIQVSCETQAIRDHEHQLAVHLHAVVDGKRQVLGQAKPIAVSPFESGPWSFELQIPQRAGLERVIAVVFASRDGSWKAKAWSGEATIAVE